MLRHLFRQTPHQAAAPASHAHRVRSLSSSALSSVVGGAISVLGTIMKPVGIGYALTLALALAAQRKLQYFPSPANPAHPMVQFPGLPVLRSVEEHTVIAADGTKCKLWHWPAPVAGERPAYPSFLGGQAAAVSRVMATLREKHPEFRDIDILQFHGNAGDRSHRLPWMLLLREGLGCSVTVLDYRGYGGSEGSPTERGLFMDGRAAYEWLQRRRSQQPGARNKTILWGESIGTGVAVALLAEECANRNGAPPNVGIVLEAGFTSCVDLGASAYPWLPVRLGMLDRYESARRARTMGERFGGRAAVPTLSLHGTLDDIAPLHLGKGLFSAMPGERKRLVVLEDTGHNDVPFRDTSRYLREVASFLSVELLASREESI